eukprot:TRINITY_DN10155_c0_g2_i4.p1 TRINITY_DN10155_c0_g2~~TRINITY_DN10155_c0_g2_i4.p1  ORF type:complete len:258 (-),score=66.76 TRINITY_DN10155_c0_g2_i4:103-876(-)
MTPGIAQLSRGKSSNADLLINKCFELQILNVEELYKFVDPVSRDTVFHIFIRSGLWKNLSKILQSFGVPREFLMNNTKNETPLSLALTEMNIDCLVFLLQNCGIVEKVKISEWEKIMDHEGNSLLHKAVKLDNPTAVELFLDLGFDVNITNPLLHDFCDSGLPIHIAAIHGSTSCLHLLLSRGGDLNSQASPFGNTPIMLAVQHDRSPFLLKCSEMLDSTSNSCHLNLTNAYGETAMDIAQCLSREECIKILETFPQ